MDDRQIRSLQYLCYCIRYTFNYNPLHIILISSPSSLIDSSPFPPLAAAPPLPDLIQMLGCDYHHLLLLLLHIISTAIQSNWSWISVSACIAESDPTIDYVTVCTVTLLEQLWKRSTVTVKLTFDQLKVEHGSLSC